MENENLHVSCPASGLYGYFIRITSGVVLYRKNKKKIIENVAVEGERQNKIPECMRVQ